MREYFYEGTEIGPGEIAEESGWYVLVFGFWVFDRADDLEDGEISE